MKNLIILTLTVLFSFAAPSTEMEQGSYGTHFFNNVERQFFDFSPHVSFGKIDRIDSSSLEYPGRTVGKLVGPIGTCTATLISDQYIATAAHCFFADGKVKRKVRQGTYIFLHSFHKNRYWDSAYITEIWYDSLYDFSFDKKLDWVVAKLSKPLGRTLGYLGYSYNLPNVHLEDSQIDIIGYGSKFENGQTQTKHQNCRIYKNEELEEVIFHDCDTSVGDSGAPIIKKIDGKLYLIGIHTSGGNKKANTNHFSQVDLSNSNVATYHKTLFETIKKARNNSLPEGTQLQGAYNDVDLNYYYIRAINSCNEEIKLAINFYNPKSSKWDVLYWYTIKANDSVQLNTKNSGLVQTKNRNIYYYAKSKSYIWSGDSRSESVQKRAGESLISMRLNKIEESRWGNYNLKITCNN